MGAEVGGWRKEQGARVGAEVGRGSKGWGREQGAWVGAKVGGGSKKQWLE
jgi:hypothetical protein